MLYLSKKNAILGLYRYNYSGEVMISFNEWLANRMDEGSLGLKRRERVAAGMAKRAERIGQIFPNPSDSQRHVASGQVDFDAQAMAGRYQDADTRMQQRTSARLQRMLQGDKTARQMMSGPGGIDATRDNADRSRQSLSALANYNNPDVLAKRGQDPNWAADGRKLDNLTSGEPAWYSRMSAEKKRRAELDRIEYQKKHGESGHSTAGADALRSAGFNDSKLASMRNDIGR